MPNDFQDYPYHRSSKGKPLIETGNREGWEEIRDGVKLAGAGITKGVKWLAGKLKPGSSSKPNL